VISGRTSAVTATIAVGATPVGVAVNPLTSAVYVTNFRGKTVSVISG
jgi:DNA-binding beta-propeller fold protein YncE